MELINRFLKVKNNSRKKAQPMCRPSLKKFVYLKFLPCGFQSKVGEKDFYFQFYFSSSIFFFFQEHLFSNNNKYRTLINTYLFTQLYIRIFIISRYRHFHREYEISFLSVKKIILKKRKKEKYH